MLAAIRNGYLDRQPRTVSAPMITVHFAGYQPARSVHTRALLALRDAVADRSGDTLAVAVTDNIVDHGPQGRRSAHHGGERRA